MARSLDGDSANNRLSRGAAVVTGAPCTLACWFWATPGAMTISRHMVNAEDDPTGDNILAIRWLASVPPKIAATVYVNPTQGDSIIDAPAEGEWHHAAGVFTSSTARLVYLDGTAGTTDATNLTPSGINQLFVGAEVIASVWGHSWNGYLAEVGIWNAALTAGNIAGLADKSLGPLDLPTNLVAYFPICGVQSPERNCVDEAATLAITGTVPPVAHVPGVPSPCLRRAIIRL